MQVKNESIVRVVTFCFAFVFVYLFFVLDWVIYSGVTGDRGQGEAENGKEK